MARTPCTFRERDVTRLIKATVKAGFKVARVESDRSGKIIIITGEGEPQDSARNEWDAVR